MSSEAATNKKKLSTNISKELGYRMEALIPWGIRTRLLETIFEDFCDAIEKTEGAIFGAILSKQFKLSDVYTQVKEHPDADATAETQTPVQ